MCASAEDYVDATGVERLERRLRIGRRDDLPVLVGERALESGEDQRVLVDDHQTGARLRIQRGGIDRQALLERPSRLKCEDTAKYNGVGRNSNDPFQSPWRRGHHLISRHFWLADCPGAPPTTAPLGHTLSPCPPKPPDPLKARKGAAPPQAPETKTATVRRSSQARSWSALSISRSIRPFAAGSTRSPSSRDRN
jgi:hypothetical protein